MERHTNRDYTSRVAKYLGEGVTRHLGVKTPVVRKIATKYYQEIKDLAIDGILGLCEELLETQISEHRTIAFQWAFRCRREYRPEHFAFFEGWLERYVDSWGSCDDLCTHALGAFLMDYPEFIPRLKEWTRSQNGWLRRASAVALIYGARRGKQLDHIFDVADSLLSDKDDLVQKGYGWMLRVASKTYQTEVFEYVMRNKRAMPRTALRYAIEKMPDELRRKAMKKDW